MSTSRRFFLDRSLRLAIGVLTGIMVLGAGGLYLAVEVAESLSIRRNWDDVRSRMHAAREMPDGRRSRGRSGRRVPARFGSQWVADHFSYSPSEAYLSRPLGAGYRAGTGSGDSYELEPALDRSDSRPSEVETERRWASSESHASLAPEYTPSSSPTIVSLPRTRSEPEAQKSWKTTANVLSRSVLALEGALSNLRREERGQSAPEERRTSRMNRSADGPTPPSDPEPVPLDGVGWLAAAGTAYAARRLRITRAKGSPTNE